MKKSILPYNAGLCAYLPNRARKCFGRFLSGSFSPYKNARHTVLRIISGVKAFVKKSSEKNEVPSLDTSHPASFPKSFDHPVISPAYSVCATGQRKSFYAMLAAISTDGISTKLIKLYNCDILLTQPGCIRGLRQLRICADFGDGN
jgi:hypothetical protein